MLRQYQGSTHQGRLKRRTGMLPGYTCSRPWYVNTRTRTILALFAGTGARRRAAAECRHWFVHAAFFYCPSPDRDENRLQGSLVFDWFVLYFIYPIRLSDLLNTVFHFVLYKIIHFAKQKRKLHNRVECFRHHLNLRTLPDLLLKIKIEHCPPLPAITITDPCWPCRFSTGTRTSNLTIPCFTSG